MCFKAGRLSGWMDQDAKMNKIQRLGNLFRRFVFIYVYVWVRMCTDTTQVRSGAGSLGAAVTGELPSTDAGS